MYQFRDQISSTDPENSQTLYSHVLMETRVTHGVTRIMTRIMTRMVTRLDLGHPHHDSTKILAWLLAVLNLVRVQPYLST